MKFTVFGIGSATPQIGKHPSAFLLEIENEYVLIDCGEGTQFRLLEHKIKHTRLRTICISHLHGDHYFGLVGLLSSLSLARRNEPLTLIGPKSLLEIVNIQLLNSGNDLSFELIFVPTDPQHRKLVLEKKHFKIECFPLIHRIPTTGFLITKKRGQRHLIPDKLPDDFPHTFIHLLKEGKDVTDELNGVTYHYLDYTTEGDPPKVFAYCSDTAFNPGMLETIKNADLIYHEATFTKELTARAQKTQHSTAEQAAEIAKAAGAKKLVLGHFSSRYKDIEGHLTEAQAVFENSELAEQGKNYEIK
ncbi:ribonuclease Z [Jiulongibacter sediminis]|uniref:Ribonuclease Z n=1 Tax=Jiulongibacter sediminis TaxID=1605367 RepID=A0A0P7C6C3_9BACT|nr:ribonuclease Z [Jiulongibacter sediminis]KPM49849.1 ribonuclease Z [Jiulongibacter sediminis]TBX26885.1 ribonuclease Z [Jiulongibacter sediminis]